MELTQLKQYLAALRISQPNRSTFIQSTNSCKWEKRVARYNRAAVWLQIESQAIASLGPFCPAQQVTMVGLVVMVDGNITEDRRLILDEWKEEFVQKIIRDADELVASNIARREIVQTMGRFQDFLQHERTC
ncbi:hypothetical protein AB6D11_00530 [Vibrio splendidus]